MERATNRLSHTLFSLLSIIAIALGFAACQGTDGNRPVEPSFHISQGKIYLQYTRAKDHLDSLSVFRADNGQLLWQAPDYLEPPVADSNTVYIPTETALVATDVDSGKVLWHTSQPMIPAAIINGIVYARSLMNASGNSFFAFQASDGRQLWEAPLSGSYIKQIEAEQEHIYVLTDSGFFTLQANNGKLLWSSPGPGGSYTNFIRANGTVYLGQWNTNGHVDALQASNGKLLWTFHTARLILTTLTSDGILCVNAGDTIYGLRARDGAQLWHLSGKNIGAFVTDNMPTANGVLYIPSFNGLLALRAQTGKELWRFDPDASIDIVDIDTNAGVIYVSIHPHTGRKYIAAVRTDGSLLWQNSSDYNTIEAGSQGTVYQLLPTGVVGDVAFEKQYYTRMDLTALGGSDGKSLWNTHFQI